MFKCKPDYEQAQKRINAFWNCEETDRPVTYMQFAKENVTPFVYKKYNSFDEQWLDLEYRAEEQTFYMENTVFYADAMPVAWPNLGPSVFSAWAGCPHFFGEYTAWADPFIKDWATDADKAVIDFNHPLFKALEKYTKLLLEKSKDNFITGLTDLHPGGDHLAALRDSAQLAIDLLEEPEAVKAKIKSSNQEYFKVVDYFTKMIKDAGQTPISTWTTITSEKTMYVPSNDFSCMISADMFREFFLEGLAEECRHLDETIYHLDGPGAIRHVDALLEIKELNAIQWVPGAGNDGHVKWMELYKKIQAGGKGLQIMSAMPEDLPLLMENLSPNGLWITVHGVNNADEAENVMKIIDKWGK